MALKKTTKWTDEEQAELKEALQCMVTDTTYCTEASYSANSEMYPDNLIPFVDKHIKYLHTHPTTDSKQYLSNLRLITRNRS